MDNYFICLLFFDDVGAKSFDSGVLVPPLCTLEAGGTPSEMLY